MSINARIRRLKRQSGINSLTLSIVRNWRTKGKIGAPNHETVAYIKTIKEHMTASPATQKFIWLKIDLELHRLLKKGKITELVKSNIERRFLEFVPRPSALPIKPIATAKPSPLERLQGRYGDLL
jgi:hypothetical protein